MQAIGLEICVNSVESARAAAAGGADRIELCAALEVGGLTPPAELLRAVRAAVEIDIVAMVRPRAGDFVYTPAELDRMYMEIGKAGALGADGIVLGVLLADGTVDEAAVKWLVEAAQPMQVTFHRAFDATTDLAQALEQVVSTGADRILTSGAGASAVQASANIKQLVNQARGRVSILAGGGVRQANVRELVLKTGVNEVHSSLGFGDGDGAAHARVAANGGVAVKPTRFVVREADVRAMRDELDALVRGAVGAPAR